mmetsp:Transcript_72813/g.225965  ORF Transcript_72813/g.225965 Transcript_72813/m.225965 type:complete len:202 (+) Transcript_72813:1-606(+)
MFEAKPVAESEQQALSPGSGSVRQNKAAGHLERMTCGARAQPASSAAGLPSGTSQIAVRCACSSRSFSVLVLSRLMSKALKTRSQVGHWNRALAICRAPASFVNLIFARVRSLSKGLHSDHTAWATKEKSTMSMKFNRSAKTEPKESENSFRAAWFMLSEGWKPTMSQTRTLCPSGWPILVAASNARNNCGRISFSGADWL